MSQTPRSRVFISYCHRDTRWLERLKAVLAPEIRNDRLDVWDDQLLDPGEDWRERIRENIARARVAILLVTPGFLASKFIREEELPPILEAAKDGLTVLWVPVAGSFYGEAAMPGIEQLNHLQAAGDTARPLEDLDDASVASSLRKLCRRIRRLVEPVEAFLNLPFGSLDARFQGREKELAELDERLRRDGAAAVMQPTVIIGAGGMGKTRLAVEYALRHREDFNAFLFVSANTPEDLDANLARLGEVLDLPEAEGGTQDEQKAAVIRWLRQNRGWLLILDNVDEGRESIQAVKSLVASLPGGHVLITSRLFGPEWGGGVRTLDLHAIGEEAARTFLLQATEGARHHRDSRDAEDAGALAIRLGCLPLALTHAAAFVSAEGISFADYLREFDGNFASLLDRHREDSIDYDPEGAGGAGRKTVATTFFMSFHRLGSQEKALLRAASLLGFAPIPVELFENQAEFVRDLAARWSEETGEPVGERSARESLSHLAKYSLLNRKDGMVTLHRMEWEIIRRGIPAAGAAAWLARVARILAAALPAKPADDPETWAAWATFRPHAEALTDHPSAALKTEPECRLLAGLSELHLAQGRFFEGLVAGRKCLKQRTRQDPESLATAQAHAALAAAYRELDLLGDAEAHADLAIRIHQAKGATGAASYATALIQKGEILFAQGRLAEREPLYREALAIRQRHFGRDHKAVAETLNNLASAVQDLRDYPQAERLYRECLATAERSVGPHDPHRCNWINNLASLYSETKRPALASRCYQQALAVIRNGPIPDHPKLVVPLANLAFIKAARLGGAAAARSLMDEAVAICVKYYGEDDAQTARARRKRRMVAALGAVTTVNWLAIATFVVAVLASLLTPGLHWSARLGLGGLGVVLPPLFGRRLLRPHLAALNATEEGGSAAPKLTASQMNQLAMDCQNGGDPDEAERLYEAGLAHPRLSIGERRLLLENQAAFLHQFRGDPDRADRVYAELIDDLRTTRGEPDSILLVKLAALRVSQGRWEEASRLIHRGWRLHGLRDDGFAPRFPFLRAWVALLGEADASLWLGQLRTMGEAGWRMNPWLVPALAREAPERLDGSRRDWSRLLADHIQSPSGREASLRDPLWTAVPARAVEEDWEGG